MYHQKYFKLRIVQTDTVDEFIELFKKAKEVYFDTETSGLMVRAQGSDYVVGYTFAFEDEVSKDVFYIPVRHVFEGEYVENSRFKFLKEADLKKNFPDFDKELFKGTYYNVDAYEFAQAIKPIFENCPKTYTAHNGSFDFHLLADEGIDIERVFFISKIDDTQIMVHTIDESVEKNLESVTEMVLKIKKSHYSDTIKTVTKDEKLSQGLKATQNASFQHVQIPIGGQYSAEDVWAVKVLKPILVKELYNDNSYEIYSKCRIPFMQVLWKMERKGVSIDIEALDKMQALAEKESESLKYNLFELIGAEFNPNSSQHLFEVLFGFKKQVVKLKPEVEKRYKKELNDDDPLGNWSWSNTKSRLLKSRENVMFEYSYNDSLVSKNLGFKPIDWTDGGAYEYEELKNPKTGSDILKKLLEQKVSKKSHEFIEVLIQYKKLSKLITAFMIGLRENIYKDGKVHCSFNLCGTDSWRLSSSDPNLQQLPHPLEEPKKGEDRSYYDFWERFEIRKLFIADKGYKVVAADYHALEKYLTAHLSQDKMLLKMLRENLDPHGTVATIVFPELANENPNNIKKIAPNKRQLAKKIGFAVDYGGTSVAVSKNLECSREEAQGYIDKYFEGFYGLHTYDKAVVKFAKSNGYVRTLGGHKRHLWDINSTDKRVASYLERVAVNVMSQGSGADVTMFAQLDVDNDPILKSIGAYMVINVHDEIVMMCPEEYVDLCKERLVYHMENCLPKRGIHLTIPLEAVADVGSSYYEAK